MDIEMVDIETADIETGHIESDGDTHVHTRAHTHSQPVGSWDLA